MLRFSGIDPNPIETAIPRGKLSKSALALQRVKDVMQQEKLYLFRGDIWFVHPQSMCTKVRCCSVSQFLGHVCANPDNMEVVFDKKAFLTNLLSDPQCTIIEQLQIDVDVIEVCSHPILPFNEIRNWFGNPALMKSM